MSIETPQISAEVLNAAFIHKLDSGLIKEAEESGSAYIRQKLYEEGLLRRLFTMETKTAEDLDPELDNDQPSILVEKEPDAVQATFLPFKGTGDQRYFDGRRFRVPFGKVSSDVINKSKFELMTIRMNIMDWLKENQVKQIHQQEDTLFMTACNDIITAASGAQTHSAGTDSFKDGFVGGLQLMTTLRLPIGQVLMNKNTYYESTKLKTDEIGHVPQEKRFNEGVESEDSFMGHKVVTTIKDDLVPDNCLFMFAPQEYFCKFYALQDATLFLKNEADMIQFHTYEALGFGIGNTAGVVKVTWS